MKSETIAAVAALATTMFLSQGTMAQDQTDQSNRPADASKQVDQADTSARQAGDRAGQRDASRARAGEGARAGLRGQIQNMDQKFVEFASTNDQFEIQAAKLAEQKAEDDQIKQMAKMIQQDHQQSSQKLQQAAQQAGVQVSQQLKPHQQAMLQELQQMEGQEFDRAWLYGQVAGHTKAVLKFRDASRESENEHLRQFAQQALPKLQQHLQHAQEMAQFDTAQTAGASERAGDQPNGRSIDRSSDRPGTGTDKSRTDKSGTDPANRRGAGTNDSGTGSSSDSGTDRSNPNR